MLQRRASLLCVFGLVVGAFLHAGPARAVVSPDAKLVLHLVPTKPGKKRVCTEHGVKAFSDVLTHGDLYPQHYLAYVLITDFDTKEGIAGVQFGVSYDDSVGRGVDVLSWQDCALYQWPMDAWPGANSGNLLTWDQNEGCQQDDPVVVGFFYLTAYSPDRLKLIPRPVDGLARVAACGIKQINAASRLDNVKPENLGWLDFGEGQGYDPWDPQQNLLELKSRFKPMGGR